VRLLFCTENAFPETLDSRLSQTDKRNRRINEEAMNSAREQRSRALARKIGSFFCSLARTVQIKE
jgi:hypothetical protein